MEDSTKRTTIEESVLVNVDTLVKKLVDSTGMSEQQAKQIAQEAAQSIQNAKQGLQGTSQDKTSDKDIQVTKDDVEEAEAISADTVKSVQSQSNKNRSLDSLELKDKAQDTEERGLAQGVQRGYNNLDLLAARNREYTTHLANLAALNQFLK